MKQTIMIFATIDFEGHLGVYRDLSAILDHRLFPNSPTLGDEMLLQS